MNNEYPTRDELREAAEAVKTAAASIENAIGLLRVLYPEWAKRLVDPEEGLRALAEKIDPMFNWVEEE